MDDYRPTTIWQTARLLVFMPMFCITGCITLGLMILAMGRQGTREFIEGLAGTEQQTPDVSGGGEG